MDRPHRRWAGVFFVGIVLCSLALSGFGAAVATSVVAAGTSPEASFGNVESEEFDADRTRFQITVFDNGSAEWVFRYEQRLETDDDLEDFETYAERFNSEETESYRNFQTRASSLTESGSDVTDREMSAETFRKDARVEERSPAGEQFAVVEMSFLWTAFAERENDQIVVGDVFVDGLYVGPDQELRFERGPELRFDSVAPEPDSIAGDNISDSETATWIGEHQFTDRHPRIVYTDRDTSTESSETESEDVNTGSEPESNADPESENGSESSNSPDSNGSFIPLATLLLVLLVGSGVVIVYWTGILSGSTEPSDSAVDRTADTSASKSPVGDGSAHSAPDTSSESGVKSAISDEELLSDEERVVALLEERGGRMKQVEIVRNTDWSKSKVSMLLSEMESEGTISKLRVGRENIVSLAGHEPDAAGSPFDKGK